MSDKQILRVGILDNLGKATDGMLATPLSAECRDFLANGDPGEAATVRFLLDLRDKCVYGGAASNFVMAVLNVALDGVVETDAERDARHLELEQNR